MLNLVTDFIHCNTQAELIVEIFRSYGVQVKVDSISHGPRLTTYEVQLPSNVQVNMLSIFANELVNALGVVTLGKPRYDHKNKVLSIDVPNKTQEVISFEQLADNKKFQNSKFSLPLIIGKDIKGTPSYADLSKMPHLLLAGVENSGKSTFLNSLILSIVSKKSSDEVQFLLIDSKKSSFTHFAHLPHLLYSTITKQSTAKAALMWAINEMNRRLTLLNSFNKSDINGYNEEVKATSHPLPTKLQKIKTNTLYYPPMPRLVVVIDNYEEIIQADRNLFEWLILRLAKEGHKVGIHLVLSTKDSSPKVVTSMLRANFLSRIAFKTKTKEDSLNILKSIGAESLVGEGDMLFRKEGKKLIRLHGATMTDVSLEKILHALPQEKASQNLNLHNYEICNSNIDDITSDPLYQEAIKLLPQMSKITISSLQRKLRIGFNKAASIKEQLEKDGYIKDGEIILANPHNSSSSNIDVIKLVVHIRVNNT